MNLRKVETGLAYFTLGALVIYIPGETWASWPELWDPFYLVDLIGMALLVAGSVRSLRARPAGSPELLCAAWAWTGANGWRAFWGRVYEVQKGGILEFGNTEIWVVGIATAITLVCLTLGLLLVISSRSRV